MKKSHALSLVLSLQMILGLSLGQAGNLETAASQYQTGIGTLTRLAQDLHRALEPKNQEQFAQQPLVLDQGGSPRIQAARLGGNSADQNKVLVSEECVTLINYVSHAKAMENVVRGYFEKYMDQLSSVTGDGPLPTLPSLNKPEAWSLDTMNLQKSHFNQIMGALVAIDMSHHYLGHYDKYQARLQAGAVQNRPAPINAYLTKKEWRNAVLKGARNALDCGLGVDGLKDFLLAMDKMPQRPAWTYYFLPADVKVSKVAKALEKLENNFFLADY